MKDDQIMKREYNKKVDRFSDRKKMGTIKKLGDENRQSQKGGGKRK